MADLVLTDPCENAFAEINLGDELGQLVAIDSPEALAHLKGVEFSEDNPLRVRAEIFSTDSFCRKPVVLSEDAVEKMAGMYAGLPVLERRHGAGLDGLIHGPSEVVGVVESATPEKRERGTAVIADLAIWGGDAVREIRNGVRPSFSIGFAETEDTEMSCSLCLHEFDDHGQCAGDEKHQLGENGCVGVLSDVEPLEVTRLYNPAVRGTGIRQVFLDAGGELDGLDAAELGTLLKGFLSYVAAGTTAGNGNELALTEPLIIDAPIAELPRELSTTELEANARVLQAESDLAMVRGQLIYEEARTAAVNARRSGRFGYGDADELTQLFVDSGKTLSERWISFVAPHPAHIANLTQSGMGREPGVDDPLEDISRHRGDWAALLFSEATKLSKTEGITYNQAHQRLYEQYRPADESISRPDAGPGQPRRR